MASTAPSRPSALAWPTGFFSVGPGPLARKHEWTCFPTFVLHAGRSHASVPFARPGQSRSAKKSTAPSKEPRSPSAFYRTGTNLRRDCHLPTTVGASRVSHPLRAFTVPCAFPGLFHPGPAHGVHPSGPSPFAEPRRLSTSVALLAFVRRRSRPTVRRTTRLRAPGCPATRALRHVRPSAFLGRRPRPTALR